MKEHKERKGKFKFQSRKKHDEYLKQFGGLWIRDVEMMEHKYKLD